MREPQGARDLLLEKNIGCGGPDSDAKGAHERPIRRIASNSSQFEAISDKVSLLSITRLESKESAYPLC